jgi:hypothetical protein
MDKKSRRGLLTKGAAVAAVAAGAALSGKSAQAQPKLEKRSPYPPPNPPPANKPMFSRAVVYGNMLFLAVSAGTSPAPSRITPAACWKRFPRT